MAKTRKGICIPLSPARRVTVELMHHAKKCPTLPLKRSINVAALAMARLACPSRPSWTALFLKAYAMVARDRPELRRTYVPLPWPHIYEHTHSESTVLVEREFGDEKIVLGAKIRGPDEQMLKDIDSHLRRFAHAPLETISDFRQLMLLGRMPRWLRRFMFWSTLSLSGYKKCKRFGTFMVGSLGNLGVEQCHPLTTLTTYLSFGPISPSGEVVALICYDHRVMDGRTVAQALNELEVALQGPILAEVKSQSKRMVA